MSASSPTFLNLTTSSADTATDGLPEWANILGLIAPAIPLTSYYAWVKISRSLFFTAAEIHPTPLQKHYAQLFHFTRSETEFLLCLGAALGLAQAFYEENPDNALAWPKIPLAFTGWMVAEAILKLATTLADATAQDEAVLKSLRARGTKILNGFFGSLLTGIVVSATSVLYPQFIPEILKGNLRTIGLATAFIQIPRQLISLEMRWVQSCIPPYTTGSAEMVLDEESPLLFVSELENPSISFYFMWLILSTLGIMGSILAVVMASQQENAFFRENAFDPMTIGVLESSAGAEIATLLFAILTGSVAGMMTLLNQCHSFEETEHTIELDADDERLLKEKKIAAKQGNESESYLLGIQYMTHKNILNYRQAYFYLKAAWENNITRAGSYLGLLYEYVFLNDRNEQYDFIDTQQSPLETALFLYQHADQDYTLNQVILSACYLRKLILLPHYENPAETAAQLLRAASCKNYQEEDNYINVLAFLETMAARPDSMAANLILALVYHYALLGVEDDPGKAADFFEKIAASEAIEDIEAQYYLGLFYQKGFWEEHKNLEEGFKWLKYAADHHHAEALFNLEIAYRTGLGCAADPERAQQCLQKAAEYGHSTARSMLQKKNNLPPLRNVSNVKGGKKHKKKPPRSFPIQLSQTDFTQYISSPQKALTQVIHHQLIHTEELACVRALRPWTATALDELSIQKDEILYVLKDEGEWQHCRNTENRCGRIPRIYLEEIPAETIITAKNSSLGAANTLKTIDKEDIEIKEEIGRGGTGMVYRGYWKSTQMSIAIKTLQPNCVENKKILEEYQNELKIIANLHYAAHPNIVTFFALSNDEPQHLIMEYMDKGSLWQYLGGRKKEDLTPALSSTECAIIAVHIINGLCHLHNNNFLHRDVKSPNVLLSSFSGNKFCAKLTDLGSAIYCEQGKSIASTQVIGSTFWQAPEVLSLVLKQSGQPTICHYSRAADVYSYGMVLWELLTHNKPYATFEGDHIELEIADYVLIQHKREIIPAETASFLKDLIQRCWQTNPEERPTSTECVQILNMRFDTKKNEPWVSSGISPRTKDEIPISEMGIAISPDLKPSSLKQSFFYHKPPKRSSYPDKQNGKKEEIFQKRVQSAGDTISLKK